MKKILSVSLIAVAASFGAATSALAETKIPFALDWKFEGPSAAYFAAVDNGHFGAVGLDVEISAGSGSLDAIPKVATGAYPIGFADINSLIKFKDQNPDAPVIAANHPHTRGYVREQQPPVLCTSGSGLRVSKRAHVHVAELPITELR